MQIQGPSEWRFSLWTRCMEARRLQEGNFYESQHLKSTWIVYSTMHLLIPLVGHPDISMRVDY
jgi:hypothetical protein